MSGARARVPVCSRPRHSARLTPWRLRLSTRAGAAGQERPPGTAAAGRRVSCTLLPAGHWVLGCAWAPSRVEAPVGGQGWSRRPRALRRPSTWLSPGAVAGLWGPSARAAPAGRVLLRCAVTLPCGGGPPGGVQWLALGAVGRLAPARARAVRESGGQRSLPPLLRPLRDASPAPGGTCAWMPADRLGGGWQLRGHVTADARRSCFCS